MVTPYYPRSSHETVSPEGSGIFRLYLDWNTGRVRDVKVLQSTGYGVLDASATYALRQWQLRPGKWKQIDVPVRFTMSESSGSGRASPPFVYLPTSGPPVRGGVRP